ncbi:unnamed protein product, partial [Dibothriocephalus latus]
MEDEYKKRIVSYTQATWSFCFSDMIDLSASASGATSRLRGVGLCGPIPIRRVVREFVPAGELSVESRRFAVVLQVPLAGWHSVGCSDMHHHYSCLAYCLLSILRGQKKDGSDAKNGVPSSRIFYPVVLAAVFVVNAAISASLAMHFARSNSTTGIGSMPAPQSGSDVTCDPTGNHLAPPRPTAFSDETLDQVKTAGRCKTTDEPASGSEDTDTVSDTKAWAERFRCATLRDPRKLNRHSVGMAAIDSSAPETTSSDNSPTASRRFLFPRSPLNTPQRGSLTRGGSR